MAKLLGFVLLPVAWDALISVPNDCNNNGISDADEIASGASEDCDLDGYPDGCYLAAFHCTDVNCNGTPDACEPVVIFDCNGNGVHDRCEIDCGAPGGPCDLPGCGRSVDCNRNCRPDECDVPPSPGYSAGRCRDRDCSADGNENGQPDECEDRCLSARADGNADCELELVDYLRLQGCFTGQAGPIDPASYAGRGGKFGCDCFDIEFDGDVDGDDSAYFLLRLTSPERLCEFCPDVWSTSLVGGVTHYDFGQTPLPAGFFSPDSSKFEQVVELAGVRTTVPGPFHYTSPQQFDTQVLHPTPSFDQPIFPCHQYVTIPLAMHNLRLAGTAPILVTHSSPSVDCNENGCPDADELDDTCMETQCGCSVDSNDDAVPDECQTWLVSVNLSDAPVDIGHLYARSTHPNGGFFSTNFLLAPLFRFTLLSDIELGVPAELVRTILFDPVAQGEPPMQLSFEDLPWSRNLDRQEHDIYVLDCAMDQFIPGFETDELFLLGASPPETTCTSHVTEEEAHFLCPPSCDPPKACRYTAIGDPNDVPAGSCDCSLLQNDFPQSLWSGPCKEDEDCPAFLPPVSVRCERQVGKDGTIGTCRRHYGLAEFEPCQSPPGCP